MKKIIAIILILVLGAIAFIWGMPMYQLHFTTIDLKADKTIYVKTGTTMDELAMQIDSEGILSKDKFSKFASDLEFDDSKIEPGKYAITAGMKIKNLIY
jgi:cell division protein YceG involved in septum cleavage